MNRKALLRILSIITFSLALMFTLYYLQSVVSTMVDAIENPLIPDQLWKYTAFSKLILSVIFIGIGAYCYRSFKKEQYKAYMITLLFICSVLFIFSGSYVYDFINSFNPYA